MKIIGIGLIAFLLFMIQRVIYEKLWNKHLKVFVYFTKSAITEGEEGEIIEVIENRKHLPLPMLKVRFQTSKYLGFSNEVGSKTTDQYYRNDVFRIAGGEKITRKLKFLPNRRGYYHIKNIDLVGSDMFLSNEMVESMTTDCFLYVYPKVFENKEFQLSLHKLNGEILVKRHLMEDPFEYRGIREYQPFDDIRSVNWKATARTGALKVNQRNYTAMQTIRIFLNLENNGILKMDKEVEASMQIAMGIAAFFLSQGIKVSCYANGRDILTDEHMVLEGGAGTGQLENIGKALARIDVEKKTKSFCDLFQEKILDEEGYFTFIISPNVCTEFIELIKTCRAKDMEFAWYYPMMYYQESKIPEELESFVQIFKLK